MTKQQIGRMLIKAEADGKIIREYPLKDSYVDAYDYLASPNANGWFGIKDFNETQRTWGGVKYPVYLTIKYKMQGVRGELTPIGLQLSLYANRGEGREKAWEVLYDAFKTYFKGDAGKVTRPKANSYCATWPFDYSEESVNAVIDGLIPLIDKTLAKMV